MDRAKKKIASAIDGLRNFHMRIELDVEERVSPDHCSLSKVRCLETLNCILIFI